MYRVISANLNGVRSAGRKGFFQWLNQQDADVVCIQETKAQVHQLEDPLYHPEGYHCYYQDAEKKGYSGVALYSKEKPSKITTELGWPVADTEGRYIQADFDNLTVISLYLPSGTTGELRQTVKYDFMDKFLDHLLTLRAEKRELIVCGDWNIAHKQIDIENWRSNQKTSGFLPEERAWMDKLFGEANFIDGFRVVNQNAKEYSWWSNRGRARENNVGWRLDYHVITPGLENKVKRAEIYRDEKFSDHAPVILDYDL